MNWVLAALLPILYWDKGPDTAPVLKQAGIKAVAVPAAQSDEWGKVAGLQVQKVDVAKYISLPSPALTYDSRTASATRAPWVHSNGWQFLRAPHGRFAYRADGKSASLAAAEAFAYGAEAVVRTDGAGLGPLQQMLTFLSALPETQGTSEGRANIGYLDDGSPQSSEFMNMLVRRNLLFRVVPSPDPSLNLTVSLGQPDYPRTDLANPKLLAEKVRANLTDEKRLLRFYGSEVVIGRLIGDARRGRLFLLNYGAERQSIPGLRIRVLGAYRSVRAWADGMPRCPLTEVEAHDGAIEFTVPNLNTIAIVDLEQ